MMIEIGIENGAPFVNTLFGSGKISREKKGKSLLKTVNDYTALDIETTGLDPFFDEIIEIGAVRVRGGVVVGQYHAMIKPENEIDEFITDLTGITNEMLSDAPTIENVLPEFLDFVGQDIIIAHNANFDVNFLYDNCVKLSLPPFSNDFIDTMRLSRRLFSDYPHHRLEDLIQNFEVNVPMEHRALQDAEAVNACYNYMCRYILDNDVNLQANITSYRPAKDVVASSNCFDESSPVFGKEFVFTGVLEKMVRKEAMQIVVNLGGLCADSVTKKTNYLVLGNNDYCATIKEGKSNKQKKAEKMKLSGCDIEILSENVFYDMINQS